MTLSSALNTAKSALAAAQTQTALVSRNIANVNTEGATRKYANVVTGSGGRVEVRSVTQSSNLVLYRNMLDSTSSLAQSTALKEGLSRIDETIGDIENGNTPAARLGSFTDALKAYAANPQNVSLAQAAVGAAQDVASALNQGAQTLDTIRRDADDALVAAAADMNKILSDIERLNAEVISGTANGRDVTDAMDDRDRAVAKLSQYVGVTAIARGNNDLLLYTDSGVTLLDKIARPVSFATTQPLVDGQAGNGFRIDGTLVTGNDSVMKLKTGKVAGLVALRDEAAVTYQTQLDEIARALVGASAETVGGASVAGLFTAVDPSVLSFSTDASGTVNAASVAGLARKLRVSSAAVSDPTKLRDGVAANVNPGGASAPLAGYAARLTGLVTALDATRSFSGNAKALGSGSLAGFAASSVSWLQEARSGATSDTEYKQTLLDRTKETLSNETGVNLDQELLTMTNLERSFQASSKILSTVDEMIKTLLNAI